MMNINEFSKKQLVFVFLNQGDKISFSNDNLVVRDKDNKIKLQTTCYRIFSLFLIGNLTITSGIIQRAQKFSFPIVLMNSSLKVYDIIGWKMEGNTLLREKQYSYDDLDLGRHLILNKLENQKYLLEKQRKKTEVVRDAIKRIDKYIFEVQKHTGDFQSLLGIEGNAAKLYFESHFNNVLWNGRKPRVKMDYINSTLDIGYTLLFNFIDALLKLYGFDTYYGVLHKQFYMRKSLVCDIIEPFRTLIDMQVKKSINLGQCKESDFEIANYRYQVKKEKNPVYVQFLLEPIMKYKEDIFKYIQMYYRAVMKEKESKEFPVFLLEEIE